MDLASKTAMDAMIEDNKLKRTVLRTVTEKKPKAGAKAKAKAPSGGA